MGQKGTFLKMVVQQYLFSESYSFWAMIALVMKMTNI